MRTLFLFKVFITVVLVSVFSDYSSASGLNPPPPYDEMKRIEVKSFNTFSIDKLKSNIKAIDRYILDLEEYLEQFKQDASYSGNGYLQEYRKRVIYLKQQIAFYKRRIKTQRLARRIDKKITKLAKKGFPAAIIGFIQDYSTEKAEEKLRSQSNSGPKMQPYSEETEEPHFQ
jgi:hypothetical protein